MVQTQDTTRRQPPMNPIEKGDALAQLGYTLRRLDTPGVYMLRKPDGATYRVDMTERRCSCPATVPYCCHLVFCDWHYARDRAASDLADARRRDVLVSECESALWAAEECLRRVVGTGAVVVTTERRQVAA